MQAVAGIDETLDGHEVHLDTMAGKILCWLEEALQGQDKGVNRAKQKVSKWVNKLHGQMADRIDGIWVTVRGWADAQLQTHDWELTQLGVKACIIDIGEGPDQMIEALNEEPDPGPNYVGRLNLWVDPQQPFFVALLEVLREIRDRLPAQAVALTGQVPGKGDMDEPALAIKWPAVSSERVMA